VGGDLAVAVSAEQLAAELRAFDGRRQIVRALRRGLSRVSRPALKQVRAHAVAILPSSGGLGAWVAAARMQTKIGYTSRSAGVRLRGTRKSTKGRSDLVSVDAGMVRAPAWGRRSRGSWHSQPVPAGWWSDPLSGNDEWRAAADAEVDAALDIIRRG
jgi:hypothetical protein